MALGASVNEIIARVVVIDPREGIVRIHENTAFDEFVRETISSKLSGPLASPPRGAVRSSLNLASALVESNSNAVSQEPSSLK